MSAKPQTPLMTVAEYLAHERAAEYKSDYIDGRLYPVHDPYRRGDPKAMAGASREHNTVQSNLFGELFTRLKACGCRVCGSDQRVRVSPTGRYNYPDIVIVCEPPQYADDDRDALVNAQVVIEVLSDSTRQYDRRLKSAGYRQHPTIREIILVEQREVLVERYVRQPDGQWTYTAFTDLAADFEFATIPARVPMADIYRGVELAE